MGMCVLICPGDAMKTARDCKYDRLRSLEIGFARRPGTQASASSIGPDVLPARVFPAVRLFRIVSRYQMDSETNFASAGTTKRNELAGSADPVRPRDKPACSSLIGIPPLDPVTM
jgi:hypothetical protein